jgi:hypothetical protein
MNDHELIDGFFKMLVIPEYWDKWWDEALEHIERFECQEKKEATMKALIELFYVRRPEAFLINNPELDQQFHRVGPPQQVNRSFKPKPGCSKCPKSK